jgi:hypothetical protein
MAFDFVLYIVTKSELIITCNVKSRNTKV